MKPKFTIVKAEGGRRGKVVATVDLLPGEIVFEEKATAHYCHEPVSGTNSAEMSQDRFLQALAPAIYIFYKNMSPEKRADIDSLYCPEGSLAYQCAQIPNIIKPNEKSKYDMPLLIRLFRMYSLNGFFGTNKYFKIFRDISRINHSCLPNCHIRFDDNINHVAVVRAIMPVKAGEELTFSHNNEDDRPTHERRTKLLRSKDFFCECPRCSALGDDTRQFNCADKKCRGACLACQPTADDTPYLLPCNVCHKAPTKQWERTMLKFERESLFNLTKRCGDILNVLKTFTDSKEFAKRLKITQFPVELKQDGSYPTLHLWSRTINLCAFLQSVKEEWTGEAQCEVIINSVRPLETAMLFPNIYTNDLYKKYGYFLSLSEGVTPPPYGLLYAKDYLQKALRMYLIMHGRDKLVYNGDKDTGDVALARVFAALPPQEPCATHCMFCEETPQNACITLCRCGRCMAVTYCTARCQALHWAAHRHVCVSLTDTVGLVESAVYEYFYGHFDRLADVVQFAVMSPKDVGFMTAMESIRRRYYAR